MLNSIVLKFFGQLLNIKSKNDASVFCTFNTRKHKAPLRFCAGAGLGAVAIKTLFAVSFPTVLSSLFVIIVYSDLNLFFKRSLQGLVFDKIERCTQRIDLAEMIGPGDQTGSKIVSVGENCISQQEKTVFFIRM